MKDERGFSLVEVAVAILVLGMVLMALIPAQLNITRLAAESRIASEANRAAQQIAESYLNESSCVDGTIGPTPWVPTTPGTKSGDYQMVITLSHCGQPSTLAEARVQIYTTYTPHSAPPPDPTDPNDWGDPGTGPDVDPPAETDPQDVPGRKVLADVATAFSLV